MEKILLMITIASITGYLASHMFTFFITGHEMIFGEKWEKIWHFGSYDLGWYRRKVDLFIPIHFFIGMVAILLTHGLFHLNFWVCLFSPMMAGVVIEIYQMIKQGFTWEKRHKKLLGHIRDVVTYMGLSWIIILF